MKQRQVIIIFGKTGTGKSFLAKRIIAEKSKRNIIFDSRFEYDDGYIVYTYPEFSEIIKQVKNDSEFHIICRMKSEKDTLYALKLLTMLNNYTFVVEEAELYIDARSQSDEFNHLINFGRHQNISLIGITQRAPQINIKFRSQYSSMFSFRQSEPNDLKKLAEYGFNPDEIKNLPDHEYKVIDNDFDAIEIE